MLVVLLGALLGGSDDDGDGDEDANEQQEAVADPEPSTTPTEESADSSTSVADQPSVPCKDTPDSEELDTKNLDLYPDRPDRQQEDSEAQLGDCVRLSGYTTFLDSAALLPQDFGEPQLVADVRVRNRDNASQPFNMFDWSVLTPAGTVITPTIFFGDGGLDSGSLVTGGEAAGKVAFDIDGPGTYYIIYKPDSFDAARGIWQVTI